MSNYGRLTSLSRYARNKIEILCICKGRAKIKQSRGHLQFASIKQISWSFLHLLNVYVRLVSEFKKFSILTIFSTSR